jgi:hypothetical protein
VIVVGFSTSKTNPISWVIRKLTGSTASHVWLAIDDPLFGRVVLEASELGYRLYPFERFAKSNTVIRLVEPPACDMVKGVQSVADLLGTSYDFEGLFGMLVVVVGRWFHRKVRNPLHSSRALFCSEAVARVLVAAGYTPAAELVPESTTPQDILDLFP